MSILVLMIVSPLLGFSGYRYLTLSFRLLKRVKSETPDLWEALERPEQLYVNAGLPGLNTITPLWPWLSWIWGSSLQPVPSILAVDHARVRNFLRLGFAFLALFMFALLVLP